MKQEAGSIMVTTMGGQAQVVTFTLDELLKRGFSIREVIVLYLSPTEAETSSTEGNRVNRAMEQLQVEFAGDRYQGQPCRLRPMPIRVESTRLTDIQNDSDAVIASEMLRELIVGLKRERCQLHLCLSGGRRMMALLLMPLAMTHFGYGDRLWHIYTPDEFREQARDGRIMHARSKDGVQLLQVPFVPLGALGGVAALDRTPSGPDETEWQTCRTVWAKLSQRQREVLCLLAAGHTPQQAAEQLSISIKTFDSHNSIILAECRLAWELPPKQRLDYHFIRTRFGPFGDRLY